MPHATHPTAIAVAIAIAIHIARTAAELQARTHCTRTHCTRTGIRTRTHTSIASEL